MGARAISLVGAHPLRVGAETPSSVGRLTLVILPVPSPTRPQVRLEVLYSEAANLAYDLDALSGSLSVDPSTQRPLWDARFLKTDEDRKAVARWGAVKAKYARTLALPGPTMPLLARNDALSVGNAMEGVELRSRSYDGMADRLSDFVPLADVEALRMVVERFREPYHRWWREVAEPKGGGFVRSLRAQLAGASLAGEVSRFARFYGAKLPEGAVGRFSLVFRADAPGPTNGQQLQGVAAVEFHADERPENRIGTLVHEFCHFLYGTRSSEADAALQARFVASGDLVAKPALNLMNEALATALGNGVVGRRYADGERWARLMRTPRSLYNDDAIDRSAKRLLPVLDAFVASGGSMDDAAFATIYLGALRAEFGDDLLRPSGMLKEAFVLTDARFGAGFSRRAVRAMHIAGAYREEPKTVSAESLADFEAQPNLSALFVVSSAHMGEMMARGVIDAGEAEALRAALLKGKYAILGRARTLFAATYVVVAEDATAALEGVRRLEERTTPLVGIDVALV